MFSLFNKLQFLGVFFWQSFDLFLAPEICPLCRKKRIVSSFLLCEECNAALPFLSELRCCLCGSNREAFLQICNRCCEAGNFPWFRAVSALPYKDEVREAIHRFKYQKEIYLANFFAHKMWLAWQEYSWPAKNDVIVPIPLHWSRFWQRGYNQAEVLAQIIAENMNVPLKNAIVRKRKTARQAGLNKEERSKNLKNAFQVKDAKCLKNASVLLIDDVFTTGNTLLEAAKVIIEAGAAEVNVLTACVA